MTAPVTLQGVNHWFGTHHALRDIDLTIAAGEYVTLLGPSGCGKTTLLSVLGGFVTPDQGRVLIGGQDVTALSPARRPTTTVFQDYALFPHMTLRDNVGFGLRMAGVARAERHRLAEAQLALVGLAGAAGKRPHELSGGQRQRVALARALAVGPEVLLLDEPLGALDLKLRRAMQDELKAIQRQVGTTFVHVTHDQEEAMAIADRIVVMNAGRIEDDGPPARVYRAPRTLFAADFMGEMNHIPARATGDAVDTPFGRLPAALPAGRAVLCLRPEAMRPASGPNSGPNSGSNSGSNSGPASASGDLRIGPVRVRTAAFFGTHARIHVVPDAAPDLVLVAHLPPDRLPAEGEVFDLAADAASVCVFGVAE